ncbi:bola protein [Phlyctochytrium arcticum]|nr:bola protein [Phlyctochytrium arcticum]
MVGPMYSRIEEKLTAGLEPATLVIIDESDKHKGHAAMRGVTRGETHFRVTAVSEKFQGKMPVARHKMIYEILSEELKDGGIHALSITAKTLAESSR